MQSMFLSNAGFKSRFECVLDFPSWNPDSLANLIVNKAKSENPAYHFDDDIQVRVLLETGMEEIRCNDTDSWANARDALALWDRICQAQLTRLVCDDDAMANCITCGDVTAAIQSFLSARPPMIASHLKKASVHQVSNLDNSSNCANCNKNHSLNDCQEECAGIFYTTCIYVCLMIT